MTKDTTTRTIKYTSEAHKVLHTFLRKIYREQLTKQYYKENIEALSKIYPTYEDFEYNIGAIYLFQTFPKYGNQEIKIMRQQAKKQFQPKEDFIGFFFFCMSCKPLPKIEPERKVVKEKDEPLDFGDIGTFDDFDAEMEESQSQE